MHREAAILAAVVVYDIVKMEERMEERLEWRDGALINALFCFPYLFTDKSR